MKTLIKKLKLIKEINLSDYSIYCSLIKLIQEDKSIINKDTISINYRCYKKEDFNQLIDKKDFWITFNSCIDMYISIEKNKLFCTIICNNGDSFYGHPTNIRFSLIISIPIKNIVLFKHIIIQEFDMYIEQLYEKELEKQKKNWI